MSIIYDALKKVETGLKTENKQVPQFRPIFLYLAIAGIGYLLAQFLFYFFTSLAPFSLSPKLKIKVNAPKTLMQPQPTKQQLLPQTLPQEQPQIQLQVQPQPSTQPAELPVLVLNGIFFTGKDGYCLINNQILKVGDEIQGLVVEKIKKQEVELSNKGSIVKLSLSAVQ